MRISCRLILLSVLALTAGATQAKAQSLTGGIPQFLPAGGWTVQKNQMSDVRGLSNIDLPCMISTSYDNGYSLRFSGAQGKILAMAIDFRQNVFVAGRKYPSSVDVDGVLHSPISGTAFSQSTLIFNLREIPQFYNVISNATKMTLDVQENPMVFTLGAINAAMNDLEACFSGKKNGAVQQASLPDASAPNASPSMALDMQKDMRQTWEDKVSPVPAKISREIQKSQAALPPIWEAKAGDSMKATLEGWASRAGVDLDWQATGSASVVDDVRVAGSFEDAVQTLMARNAAALGLDANMKGDTQQSTMQHVSQRASVSAPQELVPNRKSSNTGTRSRWSAPVGTSLQKVLQDWSKRAGVELVWESNQGFLVKNPVADGGSYEQALQSLLGQYTNEKIRPNAQLNNDPTTGRRVLFVQSSRVL